MVVEGVSVVDEGVAVVVDGLSVVVEGVVVGVAVVDVGVAVVVVGVAVVVVGVAVVVAGVAVVVAGVAVVGVGVDEHTNDWPEQDCKLVSHESRFLTHSIQHVVAELELVVQSQSAAHVAASVLWLRLQTTSQDSSIELTLDFMVQDLYVHSDVADASRLRPGAHPTENALLAIVSCASKRDVMLVCSSKLMSVLSMRWYDGSSVILPNQARRRRSVAETTVTCGMRMPCITAGSVSEALTH